MAHYSPGVLPDMLGPSVTLTTLQVALSTWTVSFSSSSYTGGLEYIVRELNISDELAVLGISLYVLGFALG
jgi:hypothetical protein